MDACSADGLANLFSVATGAEAAPRYLSFNDCDTENVVFGSLCYYATRYTFTGCRLHSTPTAAINAAGSSGWGDRILGGVVLYHSSDYFRRQGWTQIGPHYFPQQCLRLNFDQNYTSPGDEYYVCGSVMEAPSFPIYIVDAEGGQENPINGVISKNVLMGGWGSDCSITTGSAGLTIRDNLMINPNVVTRLFNEFRAFIILGGTSTSATNQAAPIRVYNNTLVSYLDGSVNMFGYTSPPTAIRNLNGYTDVTVENNVIHATRTTPTDIDQAPLQDATDQFTFVDGGYIDVGSQGDQSATYALNTATGESDFHIPETTSSAIGGITSGLTSDSGFFGVRRAVTLSGLSRTAASKGAFEPNLES